MENNLVHQTVRGDPWRGVLKDPLMTGTRQGKKMREREREKEIKREREREREKK